nr:hypothetical protein [Tanacetum cinerariifolium]
MQSSNDKGGSWRIVFCSRRSLFSLVSSCSSRIFAFGNLLPIVGRGEVKSNFKRAIDLNKTDDEEKTQEDEYVHTPNDYVPTDDETRNVDDEEYVCINEELYNDVNVEMKDVDLANKVKGDEDMIDAEKVDVEHEEINQEVVQHEVPKIQSSSLLTVPVTVILEPTVLSSIPEFTTEAPAIAISPFIPPFISHIKQSTPIPTPIITNAKTSTHTVPYYETLSAIHLRVPDLEKEVKELKNADHSTKLLATIKSEVLTAVKEYFRTNLGDTLHKTASKSFNKHPKHKALYHALMESILADEDAIDQGVADLQKKRKLINGNTSSQPKPKSTCKSIHAEETIYEAEAMKTTLNQADDMGTIDE